MSNSRTPADGWRRWFQELGPSLLLYARQLAPTPAEAEDLVQEAFLRTWRHLGDAPPAEPKGLLYLNLRRAAIDLSRERSARNRRESTWASDPSLPGASLFEPHFPETQDCRRREIERALAQLPESQREVLTLRIWGEFTFDEVSRLLDIPLQTAVTRHRSALKALSELLSTAAKPTA